MNRNKTFSRFFIELHSNFKGKLYLLIFFGILNSLLQGIGIVLIIPLLASFNGESPHFLSEVFNPKSIEELLLFYLLIIIGIGIFRALFSYYSKVFVNKFTNNFLNKSLRILLNSNWRFFTLNSPSQLINLFKTESKSVKGLAHQLVQLIQACILAIIQLGLAISISWTISFTTIGALLVMYLCLKFFFKTSFLIGKGRVNLNEQIQLILSQGFSSIKFLKTNQLEHSFESNFNKGILQLYKNDIQSAKLDAVSQFVYILFGAFILVGIVFFNYKFKIASGPSLIVLLVLLARSLSLFQNLSKSINGIQILLPSFQQFLNIIESAKEHLPHKKLNQSSENISKIQLTNISFSYPNSDRKIIKNLDLELTKGNTYLFFGPSGSGKTTTLDIICGLLQPTKGHVKYFPDGIQPSVSYVLQDSILFNGPLLNNITLGAKYSSEYINEVINQCGLTQLVKKRGLDYTIKEGGIDLSGGEKQRIALARSVISKPTLLLLDEFTSGLDFQTETTILKTIQEIKKDKIVIMVSHKDHLKNEADFVIEFE